jgi:hypothetical protein
VKAIKIDPNQIKTRDYLMLQLIQGVTKSGIAPDRKKEQNRKECRRPVQDE